MRKKSIKNQEGKRQDEEKKRQDELETKEKALWISVLPTQLTTQLFVVGKPTPLPAALAYLYLFVPYSLGQLRSFIARYAFGIFIIDEHEIFVSPAMFATLFGNFVTQNLTIKDNSMRSKILQASWIIFTCVISLSYSKAVLLSFLSILPKRTSEKFLELSNAVKKGEMKSYVIFGAIVESFPHEFSAKSPQDSWRDHSQRKLV
ncbi:glutamate receptor ionotropic, delta-2 [Caerostris extrusa]|uniref:Glutamate receptor ionotropic, delta-2 n=1 Tax=Caerostris extrusa TaxID=172846 RepID=A0AAV4SX46_CAEEX|nr:glutamate receptor ionotropic, delta-2 [Caerostris extrusa]